MKVRLLGINFNHIDLDSDDDCFVSLLNQISYPIEEEVQDNCVCLKKYIKDRLYPLSPEIWGISWFNYEEIKE